VAEWVATLSRSKATQYGPSVNSFFSKRGDFDAATVERDELVDYCASIKSKTQSRACRALDEFFGYLQNFKHFDPVPQFTPLYNPTYLSIENLPANIKQVARDRLLAAEAKARPRIGNRAKLSSIGTVLAHMEGPAHRISLAEFLYFSEKTDREFNDSWRKACPELEQLLTARS